MNATIKQMKDTFDRQVNILRTLGFKGSIYLKGELILITATDRNSASMIRKAMKRVRNFDGFHLNEFRFNPSSVFCLIHESLGMNRTELRQAAAAMAA